MLEQIEQLMRTLEAGGAEAWMAQAFLVVFASLVVDFIQKRVVQRIHVRLSTTDNPWDDALVEAMAKPLSLLIWVVGISFAADIVRHASDAPIFAAVGPVRDVGVIVALTWFLVRAVGGVQRNVILRGEQKGKPVDLTSVEAIGRLVRLSILITSVLVALQTLGYSVSGVLAFGGIGGIAVGVAAKDQLANFFGGLMLYLDRPFSVGDWVRSPDRQIEGTVEEIGWRLTRIRTFDKRPLYIPNATFASISVENPSRMTHRRIYETVGIRYDDWKKMDVITADVKAMLQEHPEIDTSQTLMVNFNAFATSSVDFFIYTFTRTTVWTEYHAVKQDVLLRIHKIIEDHGAEVAFPTHTVHLPDQVQAAT